MPGVKIIKARSDAKLINVTLGREGSIAYYGDKKIYVEAFLNKNTIDTTGAGDTFCACVLGKILEYGLENMSEMQLHKMLHTANAAASLDDNKKGALCSMPEISEIDKMMEKRVLK